MLELGVARSRATTPTVRRCSCACLKGAINFMSDLMRAIELPVEVDFMAVSSYGAATKTSGVVRIVKDLDVDLLGPRRADRRGRRRLGAHAQLPAPVPGRAQPARASRSARCCLKEGEQRVEQSLKYVGFTIPSDFVVGYGLDVNERYRNLDAIYTFIGEA